MRKSKQRDELLKILSVKNYHPTAEELYLRVKEKLPGVGIASIYRNLDQLFQLNMISKIDVPDKPARYDGNIKKHHHFLCKICKKMTDVFFDNNLIENNKIKELLPNYNLTEYSIELKGVCDDCMITRQKIES